MRDGFPRGDKVEKKLAGICATSQSIFRIASGCLPSAISAIRKEPNAKGFGNRQACTPRRRARLYRHYQQIDMEYMPAPYPGKVTLFWSRGESRIRERPLGGGAWAPEKSTCT